MRKLLGAVALVGMLAMPGMAQAQTVVGGTLVYNTEGDGTLGIGGYVGIPLPQIHENLSLKPDFIYYFPDVGTVWEVNGDLVYRFDLSGNQSIIPMALAGINILHGSYNSFSNTDVGLNLGGAIVFPLETIRPVVGAKFEIQDNTAFVLFGGVGFTIG